MNVIEVLREQVEKWQEENECGLCWEFVPAGRADYFNNIQLRDSEDCCVYVGVLEVKNASKFESNAIQLVDKKYCDWNVKLIAGIPSRLDIQFYNENPSYPTNESKWDKYISKIFECLSACCVEVALCNIHNSKGLTSVEPVRWESEMVMNYKDLNLDGVMVLATFREYV